MHFVSGKDIDPDEFMKKLDTKGAGSVVTHLGVCKADPEGKKSSGVSFTVSGDPESELSEIEADLREKYQLIDLVLAKRTGRVEVGQVILFAAAAAKDRKSSFGACMEAVERCKRLKGLVKKEYLIEES